MRTGDYQKSYQYNLEAKRIAEIIGHKSYLAFALEGIGDALGGLEKYDEAKQFYRQSLSLRTDLYHLSGMLCCKDMLGFIALIEGDENNALLLYQQAYDLAIESRARWDLLMTSIGMARVNCHIKQYREAWGYLQQGVKLAADLNSKQNMILLLIYVLQVIKASAGVQADAAIRLATLSAANEALIAQTGFKLHPYDQTVYQRALATRPAPAGGTEIAAAWARGETLSLAEISAEAAGWQPPRPAAPAG